MNHRETALSIIRDGLDAVNAAYEQAQAEYQGHDKTAERREAVVRKFRTEARAFLTETSDTPVSKRPRQIIGDPCPVIYPDTGE